MAALSQIGFTAPWVLLALLALPVLWIVLRAVPPAPLRRRFPAVALLLGLRDDDSQADRTPWWLLLLRALAVAALIIGFAGPVLRPDAGPAGGSGPLLVLADGTWADAPVWDTRREAMRAAVEDAGRRSRPVAFAMASDPGAAPRFSAPGPALSHLSGAEPHPWGIASDWAEGLEGSFDTLWFSDGLGWPDRAALLKTLETHGTVRVIQPARAIAAITGAEVTPEGANVTLSATAPAPQVVEAIGRDPSGVERVLAVAALPAGDTAAQFDLPSELRNRVTRFAISGGRSAGGTWLTGGDLRRRKVALISGHAAREQIDLLSPLHYLRQALAPTADLIDGTLLDVLQASPDVLVLSDVADLAPTEAERITDWLTDGGLLLRFAGAAMARAEPGADPLLPVELRAGGRELGGALSWDAPKPLAAFEPGSPFHGLAVPPDVTVSRQILAQPGPDLAGRVIARLQDGTPLVTRKRVGQGQVVLFHVTANAEWSSLPLSGLFVEMLARLSAQAGGIAEATAGAEGTTWQISAALDAYGALSVAEPAPGIDGSSMEGPVGPDLRPGLYQGDGRVLAVNAAPDALAAARWPARITVDDGAALPARPLGGALLAAGLAMLLVDVLASLRVAGLLALLIAPLLLTPGAAPAQDPQGDDLAVQATGEVTLAHVLSGDPEVDEIARAGLYGLSNVLFRRTSIEPALPIGVDIETDELAFFPMLYWPVTEDQDLPSPAAISKLNRYLRGGGMIVFDTRDAGIAGAGRDTPAGLKLRAIAAPLDIPPLEAIPQDHVMTRSFYLLRDFPGRYNAPIWVEASDTQAAAQGDAPFRDLNDGVSPVVIGGNDWAGAWAMDDIGNRLLPVGRGAAGERQREMAYRFGVNLMMNVLTGNYKSDQVHVPALLDRLGEDQ